METKNTQEKTFPLFKILYANIALIIILTIIGGILGMVVGFVKDKPVYTARTSMIIKASIYNNASTNPTEGLNTTGEYFYTITEIIDAPDTINRARSIRGDDGISRSAVGVSSSENSLIFSISYRASSEELAVSRLKDVIEATRTLINEKDLPVNDIQLIDLQREPSCSSSKGLTKYVLVGVLAGAIGSVVIAILLYLTDVKIHSQEELEEITGTSVLAFISKES